MNDFRNALSTEESKVFKTIEGVCVKLAENYWDEICILQNKLKEVESGPDVNVVDLLGSFFTLGVMYAAREVAKKQVSTSN